MSAHPSSRTYQVWGKIKISDNFDGNDMLRSRFHLGINACSHFVLQVGCKQALLLLQPAELIPFVLYLFSGALWWGGMCALLGLGDTVQPVQ